MSRCSRCGLERGLIGYPVTFPDKGVCYAESVDTRDELHGAIVDCRDRELANLRSLLRSVTGNLERAAELLTEDTNITINDVRAAAREIDTVLEVLS